MTVKELIEYLGKFPKDIPVVIDNGDEFPHLCEEDIFTESLHNVVRNQEEPHLIIEVPYDSRDTSY